MPGPASYLPYLSKIRRADGSLLDIAESSAEYASLAVLDGKYRIAGAKLSPTLGQVASFNLQNPAGSGGNLIVRSFKIFTNTANDVSFLSGAASTGATAAVFNPLLGSAAPVRWVLKTGINVLTGGVQLSPVVAASPNYVYAPDLFVVIPPGAALGIQYSAASAGNIYGIVHWVEP